MSMIPVLVWNLQQLLSFRSADHVAAGVRARIVGGQFVDGIHVRHATQRLRTTRRDDVGDFPEFW